MYWRRHIPQHVCGGQRMTLGSWLSHYSTWVPGMESGIDQAWWRAPLPTSPLSGPLLPPNSMGLNHGQHRHNTVKPLLLTTPERNPAQ